MSHRAKERIEGYDLARCMAIFGMVLVNYGLVLSNGQGSAALIRFSDAIQGRAVPIFVVLAGVGITLNAWKAVTEGCPHAIFECRKSLLKRAGVLVAVGFIYTPIWPADILHFYGLYFVVATSLLTQSDRVLLCAATGFVAGFVVLASIFDYEADWCFDTLQYSNFWIPTGLLRNLLFNGFHPVVPWTAYLILGMWLARQHILDRRWRRKAMVISGVAFTTVEVLSDSLISFVGGMETGLTGAEIRELFGTAPMPPLPLYMAAGSFFAIFAVLFCVEASLALRGAALLRALSNTGKMSLTLYMAHVVLGLSVMDMMGMMGKLPVESSLLAAVIFNVGAVVFANLWFRRYRFGPFEWLFHKLVAS